MILAMDIAGRTGVALGKPGAAPHCFTVDLGKTRSLDERLSKLLGVTSKLIAEHKPVLLAAEDKIGGRKSNAALIQMFGCVRGVAANRGVRFEAYAVSKIRSHFLGRNLTRRDFPGMSEAAARAAIKAQVIKRCRILGWTVEDDDQADAAALFDLATALEGVQVAPAGGLFQR